MVSIQIKVVFSDVSSVKTLYGFVFREFTLLPIFCFSFVALIQIKKHH
jgi:hypothetical protein